MPAKRSGHRGVQVIGGFKLGKGVLLVVIASGLLSLLHKDVAQIMTTAAQKLNLDANSHYIRLVIEKVLRVSPNFPLLSIATFVYGGLFVTEGIGLLMQKRWAEYLTVIVTASFLPLEGYEMFKHPSAAKAITIAVNVAIVVYLIVRLKRDRS